MKIRPGLQKRLAVVLVVSFVLTLIVACGGGTAAPASDVAIDGKALLEGPCTQCHGAAQITSQSKTRDEWLVTVDRMIGKGAVVNAQEKEVLVDYLAKEYGP